MPDTTNGLPYPAATDTPDVVRDVFALATELDPWVRKAQCLVYQSGSVTSVPSGTTSPTVVVFHAFSYETPGTMWDAVSNPSRVTVPATGVYRVDAQLSFASAGGSPAGYREAQLLVNGTAVARDRDAPIASASSVLTIGVDLYLTSGDYVELGALQNNGTTLDTVSGLTFTRMNVRYVGPQ